MPRVYEHIEPLQKRAIDFFRQRIHELGAPGEPNSTIDELTLQLKFYEDFMVELWDGLDRIERSYLLELKKEAQMELNHAKQELAIVLGIQAKLNPCGRCHGYGELRHIVDQDHSEYTPCDQCGGNGSYKPMEALSHG